jgi:hypothetical protein
VTLLHVPLPANTTLLFRQTRTDSNEDGTIEVAQTGVRCSEQENKAQIHPMTLTNFVFFLIAGGPICLGNRSLGFRQPSGFSQWQSVSK